MFPKQGECLEFPKVIGMSQLVRMTNEVNMAIPSRSQFGTSNDNKKQ